MSESPDEVWDSGAWELQFQEGQEALDHLQQVMRDFVRRYGELYVRYTLGYNDKLDFLIKVKRPFQ